MNAYQIAGGFIILIAAAMCVPVIIVGTRPRAVHPSRAEIDAAVERALRDGEADAAMAAACERERRAHLTPLPNAEVTRRINVHMDAACLKLRDDIETWGA